MPVCTGACSFQCNLPTIRCGSVCVDSTKDVHNCGACGKTCPAVANGTPICSGSSCSVACNAGRSLCSGACVNINSDDKNCGGCGKSCVGNRQCSGGVCQRF
jgi:hypothetical protein